MGEMLFVSPFFDIQSDDISQRATKSRAAKHIYAGSQRISTELITYNPLPDGSSGNGIQGNERYYHSDHLGSSSLLTTNTGTMYQRIEYFADGAPWIEKGSEEPALGYKFTGKFFDVETGLYDHRQRFYDPKTSMWLGVDPLLSENGANAIGHPGVLSLYSYANNGPLKFIDPDGRTPKSASTQSTQPSSPMSTKEQLMKFATIQNVIGIDMYVIDATNPEVSELINSFPGTRMYLDENVKSTICDILKGINSHESTSTEEGEVAMVPVSDRTSIQKDRWDRVFYFTQKTTTFRAKKGKANAGSINLSNSNLESKKGERFGFLKMRRRRTNPGSFGFRMLKFHTHSNDSDNKGVPTPSTPINNIDESPKAGDTISATEENIPSMIFNDNGMNIYIPDPGGPDSALIYIYDKKKNPTWQDDYCKELNK